MRAEGVTSGLAVFSWLAVLLVAGCQQHGGDTPPTIPAVSGERAMAHVRAQVAIGARPSGSAGARQTVELITGLARKWGYKPVVDPWTETTPAGQIDFQNVYVRLDAPGDDFVLIGTHYDSKTLEDVPEFEGANDAGSSTGLVLELMQLLAEADTPPPLAVEFAFFDGEECVQSYGANDGLHGSKRLAAALQRAGRLPHCRAMILLDMVGDRDLSITIPPGCDGALARAAFATAAKLGARDQFGYFLNGGILDDHTPFQERGVPTLNLIDFQFGPDNSYWHTAGDTLDKLSTESLETVGNVVVHMLYGFDAK